MHGRNWARLSEAVPSKTLTQIKNYYQNYKVKVTSFLSPSPASCNTSYCVTEPACHRASNSIAQSSIRSQIMSKNLIFMACLHIQCKAVSRLDRLGLLVYSPG